VPESWFNVVPHLPTPLPPPLHPVSRLPVGPDALAPLFPRALIAQEMSIEPWVDVPGEVLDILRAWRPTPLVRARRLERALDTPARIYFKDESVSPAGSHKPNTAMAQAFYNKQEGVTRLTTDAGPGRWGSALALACSFFGLECEVYTARRSYVHEPDGRVMIETWGGSVVPSPVDDRTDPGSRRSTVSDAVSDATSRDDTHYAPGSVLNHVLLHQTVIGLEATEQLALAGEEGPDVVIGGCGGGSNLAGIALPFVPDAGVRLMAVEPSSCPTLTSGRFDDDVGAAPIIANLVRSGRMEAVAYPQGRVFEAAIRFARTQGPIPSPETARAVRAAVDEALMAREEGTEKVILFSYAGHGLLDLAAYRDHLNLRPEG